jgi:hypothetical protein
VKPHFGEGRFAGALLAGVVDIDRIIESSTSRGRGERRLLAALVGE